MGRKPVPQLEDWPWLEHKISEINHRKTLWRDLSKRGWTKERLRNGFQSLIADGANLRRLIRLASIGHNDPITHFLRDSMRVTFVPPSQLELDSPGLISRIISERVPVDRLRICPSCNLIFWKRTKRSETCGKRACVEKQSRRKQKEGKK